MPSIKLMKDVPTLKSERDAQWIKEAITSGPEEPPSRKKFDAAVKNGLAQAASIKPGARR